jgi:hypothetical protein
MNAKKFYIVLLMLQVITVYAAEPVEIPAMRTRTVELASTLAAGDEVWVKISEHITGRHDDPIIWQGRVPSSQDRVLRIDLPLCAIRLSFFLEPRIDFSSHKAILTQDSFIGRVFIGQAKVSKLNSLLLNVTDTGFHTRNIHSTMTLHFSDGTEVTSDLVR